jgi:hypothetical protein
MNIGDQLTDRVKKHTQSQVVIEEEEYTYSDNGHMTSRVLTTGGNDYTTSYQYDVKSDHSETDDKYKNEYERIYAIFNNSNNTMPDQKLRGKTPDSSFNQYDTEIGFWVSFYDKKCGLNLDFYGNSNHLGLIEFGNLVKAMIKQESSFAQLQNGKEKNHNPGWGLMAVTNNDASGLIKMTGLQFEDIGIKFDSWQNIGAGIGHLIGKLNYSKGYSSGANPTLAQWEEAMMNYNGNNEDNFKYHYRRVVWFRMSIYNGWR